MDELVEDGVAFSDGRLQPEDRILEINGENVRDAPQEKVAFNALAFYAIYIKAELLRACI